MALVATFFQCQLFVSERHSDVSNINYTNIFANWNNAKKAEVYLVTIKIIAKEQ